MRNIEAKFKGLITGALMVIASVSMFYVMKIPAASKGQYIVWVIYTAGIAWSLISFKTNNAASEASFKNYFSEGFKTFIVSVLLIVVYTFIFYKLNPQILNNAITENSAMLVKEGNHTPAEIADNAAKFRSIFIPGMLMVTTVIYLLMGALVTAIGSGFLSQKSVRVYQPR